MKVFLGGTCGKSKWREELIEMLEIDYFNPVVENWTEECMAEEIKQRKECDICLYVITPETPGLYSFAEAVDDSNKRPNKTVFCYLFTDNSSQSLMQDHYKQAIKKISDMIRDNGAVVLSSLKHVALYCNTLKNKDMSMDKKQQVYTRYSRHTSILTRFSFEAFHKHEDADPSVYFLRQLHRHMFHVEVEMGVIDDQPIEPQQLKTMLEYFCQNNDMNNLSCTEICQKIQEQIVKHYDITKPRDLGTETRGIYIEVSEDGENGVAQRYHPSNIVIGNRF